ncbi:MAG: phosphatase PAP2 family protein [Saprospiraceae bacterium]
MVHSFCYKVGLLFFIVVALLSKQVNGQIDSFFLVKKIALPASLMASGLILNKESIKTNFQNNVRNKYPDIDKSLDDYLMFAPTAMDVVFTLSDGHSNNLKNVSDIIIGEIIMYATTKSLKKIIDSRRPDGGRQSFPSGHTSQAFTGATLFFHHYKSKNIWLASSAYALAIATGTFRVLNNRHWVSDVFFGAGLGTLVGTLTYYFNPIGKDKMTEHVQIAVTDSGLSLHINF